MACAVASIAMVGGSFVGLSASRPGGLGYKKAPLPFWERGWGEGRAADAVRVIITPYFPPPIFAG